MPILVQWKWQENTKTFLVIFHFDDDFSKTNLRTRRMTFRGKDFSFQMYIPEDLSSSKYIEPHNIRTVVTWAPSHIETGLLSEVLSYANIINGFSEEKKRRLLRYIPGLGDFIELQSVAEIVKFRQSLGRKVATLGYDEIDKKTNRVKFSFCAELCPEYIDYLREILKPYM